MIKISEFNQSLYYLGAICKFNHVFADTNKSLRQKSNRTCVECQKNIKKKYVALNPELCAERNHRWRTLIAAREEVTLPAEKKCSACGVVKPTQEFQSEKYSLHGLRSHCKICDKERQSNYRCKRRKPQIPKIPKDPELIKENRRKVKNRYKKSIKGKIANTLAQHRRKAILKAVESKNYTPTQVLTRFAEFGNQCVYCGSKGKITIDHFIPISKFGADKIENIVPACLKCNSSKNNRNPQSWFKSQSFFSLEKWQVLIEKLDTSPL